MSEAELKVKRGRIKGSMTKLKTFVEKTLPEKKTLEEFEARLEVLEKLMVEFVAVDDKLVTLEVPSEFSDFEAKYLTIKPVLVKTIKAIKSDNPALSSTEVDLNQTMNRYFDQQRTFFDNFNQSNSHSNNILEIRLPKIQIQSFTGDYKDWPSFKDLFLSSVDQREGLSASHKLQYLKGFLNGEAAALIKHITVTDANYKEAWSKLVARYDKKRHILNSYIKTFINQCNLSHPSSTMLRKLTDTSDELIRGISTLGKEAMDRDPWLIYLILNKTDSETKQAWAEEIAANDLPSYQDLINFLNKRCDALETVEPSIQRTQPGKPAIRALHSDTSKSCPECSEEHPLFHCSRFKAMDIMARRQLVTKHALCFNCLSGGHHAQKCKSRFSCHYCRQAHHSLLHLNQTSTDKVTAHHSSSKSSHLHSNNSRPVTSSNLNPQTATFKPTQADSCNPQAVGNPLINALTSIKSQHTQLPLLPTALVNVPDVNGVPQLCRLLVDSGAQASFVSEDCVQRLRLKRERSKIAIEGLGSVKTGYTKGRLALKLTSRLDKAQHITIHAFVLNKLTSVQPATDFQVQNWDYIKGLPLADPTFNRSSKIDILLGAEHFIQILKEGQRIIQPHHPALQNTIFGYIVAGVVDKVNETLPVITLYADIIDIDAALRKFWEIEEIPQQEQSYTVEEQFCESHFMQNHYIDEATGCYTVRLPFKEDSPPLGNSLETTIRRFKSLENRFEKDPNLYKDYSKFINEYKRLRHLEPIPSNLVNTNEEHVYLPHHAIIKQSSTTTKLRVVFDGSAKTSSGISLNQKLLVGPRTQRDLFDILLSFRTYKVAVTSDIEKMYRMILVDQQDRTYQRIIWRENINQPIQHLWLNTVTYGTSSAPFLATRALKQLCVEFQGQFPLAEQAINNSFYVDDLMSGAGSIDEAIQLQEELPTLLERRGFRLRKWASNAKEFLNTLPSDICSFASVKFDAHPDALKVLGIKWIPAEDCFIFDVNLPGDSLVTKRTILSESSRIFDPLGLLSPITIAFKIILQSLWLNNYGWDDQVTGELAKRWHELRRSIHHIQKIRIPRWLETNWEALELHGFSDASESAYAAVVYCRSTSHNGNVSVTLVASKTRVAPIKQVSIPRLELCAAMLLANLLKHILVAFGKPNVRCFAWTDSMVVLSWLSSHPRRWKTYVGNRTAEILTILPRSCWNHVPSKENPADIASRGTLPQTLVSSELWWKGPSWLIEDYARKISVVHIPNTETELEKKEVCINMCTASIKNDTLENLFSRKSTLRLILRILGWCIRFIINSNRSSTKISVRWLTASELKDALKICLRWTQADAFTEEIQALQDGKQIANSRHLRRLNPFIDADKIIRVGGRLENAVCSYDIKHPIILPKNHIFVDLLIKHTHERYYHVGTSLLLSILRQKYWIISCRFLVKRHITKCVICTRYRKATSNQLMGNLPFHRVSFTQAFENVGVDYAGPFSLLRHRGRGAKVIKGYIALFVCFSTKACHVEVVSDLSADAFIACLKRFIARRGIPLNMYSDNATNFVGANRKLCELYNLVNSQNYNMLVADILSDNHVTWHFNPPSAPHFGGIWEAGVKSVKTLLKRTIGETRLTFEELTTLVTGIEGILNSRPLMPTTDDTSSLDAITPAHFLIGRPITALPEPAMVNARISTLTRWRFVQKMLHDFWKRWHLDYMTSLQSRPKWTRIEANLRTGDLVLIKESNLPPSAWVLGRVIEEHPGRDNLVRVVTLRTSKGEVKRPAAKLVKLPIN